MPFIKVGVAQLVSVTWLPLSPDHFLPRGEAAHTCMYTAPYAEMPRKYTNMSPNLLYTEVLTGHTHTHTHYYWLVTVIGSPFLPLGS